jgi:hypothetical protein
VFGGAAGPRHRRATGRRGAHRSAAGRRGPALRLRVARRTQGGLPTVGAARPLVARDVAGDVVAVVTGSRSVFLTRMAREWLILLRAIEQPHRAGLVRVAALTCVLGWTAARIATAGDVALDELGQRVLGWRDVLGAIISLPPDALVGLSVTHTELGHELRGVHRFSVRGPPVQCLVRLDDHSCSVAVPAAPPLRGPVLSLAGRQLGPVRLGADGTDRASAWPMWAGSRTGPGTSTAVTSPPSPPNQRTR